MMMTKALSFSGNKPGKLHILLCSGALLPGGLIYILFHASEPALMITAIWSGSMLFTGYSPGNGRDDYRNNACLPHN
jgi:hypothetical protein